MATPVTYGSSYARDRLQDAAATTTYGSIAAMPDPLTYCIRPGTEPTTSAATEASAVRFLAHCTTVGMPIIFLFYFYLFILLKYDCFNTITVLC